MIKSRSQIEIKLYIMKYIMNIIYNEMIVMPYTIL